MPTGIIINSLSIILGGIAGGLFGDYLRDDFKENLNLIFGLASMVMGISAIMNMVNMPAVIFAVVIGTIIGLAHDEFYAQPWRSQKFPAECRELLADRISF